jgi:hypothetical protein
LPTRLLCLGKESFEHCCAVCYLFKLLIF